MTQKGQHLMDVEAVKLLPCPFCGGEASVIGIRDGRQVSCKGLPRTHCFAKGPAVYHGPDGYAATEVKAITAWNTRTQALAAQATEQEPVAWMYTHPIQLDQTSIGPEPSSILRDEYGWTETPLYAHPPVNTQATDSEKHRNDLYDKVMDQLATIGSQGRKIDAQATELAELRAENEALRKMTDPTWFYFGNDQSSDQCRYSVHEVIDEDFCWDNRKTGEHVIEIATAGPLPTIWAHVKFLTDEEKDAAETDEDYILTEFSTEEEASTLLAKHGGGDAG